MKPIIGVALPTRGMIMTETMTSLVKNMRLLREDILWGIFTTTDLPIPDGHMKTVEDALNSGATHVWMIEEDVVFPDGLLEEMLALDAPVVASDYPQAFGESVIARKDGKVIMASTGCLLVKREVFDQLEKPYFGINRNMSLEQKDGKWEVKIAEGDKFSYGGQEVFFSSRLYEAGIPIVETKLKCEHIKVNNTNFNSTNKGCHSLEKIIEITKPIQEQYDL